jgi:hypothetical protein
VRGTHNALLNERHFHFNLPDATGAGTTGLPRSSSCPRAAVAASVAEVKERVAQAASALVLEEAVTDSASSFGPAKPHSGVGNAQHASVSAGL